MSQPLVIEPGTGVVWSYDDLASRLLGETLRFRPRCRPTSLWDAAGNILSALGADRDLTLIPAQGDSLAPDTPGWQLDRGEQEVDAPRCHSARSLAELLEKIRTASRGGLVLLTSGSTGLPKAVRQDMAHLVRGVRTGVRHEADIWGFAYNPAHIAGVQVLLQAVFNRNPLVDLVGLPRDAACEAIAGHRVSHLSATPSFYRLLLPADRPLESVRSVSLGGEPTDASLIARLRSLFPNARFRNLYASTEAGTVLVADGDVFTVPAHLEGLVEMREGRLHLHASLLGEFDSRGSEVGDWYDTGDVVEVLETAPMRFRITGRARAWINVGGNKVNPAEVEAVLQAHDGVREARVYGRPQSLLGQMVCADLVALGTPPDEGELRRYLASRLPPYQIPRSLRWVEALDRSHTGKRRDGP